MSTFSLGNASHFRWGALPLVAFGFANWCGAISACSATTAPGIELAVSATVTAPELDGGSSSWQSDLGYTVTLDSAYLTLGSFEILPCKSSAAARLWHWLHPEGVAWAHSTASPTKSGEPLVIALSPGSTETQAVGVLRPPPADYCAASLEFNPADDDASALPTDVDMVGLTLSASGTWSKAGKSGPFTLSSDKTLARPVDVAFTLSREENRLSIQIDVRLEHAFDGIDFASDNPDDQARRWLSNVSDDLELTVQ